MTADRHRSFVQFVSARGAVAAHFKTRVRFRSSRPWVNLPPSWDEVAARKFAGVLRRAARAGYAIEWKADATGEGGRWLALLELADRSIVDVDLDDQTKDTALGHAARLCRKARALGLVAKVASRAVHLRPLHRPHPLALSPQDWPNDAGVYFALANDRIKIGKAGNVAERLTDLGTSCPYPIQLLAVAPGGLAEEAAYHKRFASYRRQREWFEASEEIVRECVRLRDGAAA